MELTVSQLHHYLHCPMKYNLLDEHHLEGTEAETTTYKKAIHKTIYSFFHSVNGGWVPSANEMKQKWATTWSEYNGATKNDLLAARPVRKNDPKLVKGFEMIHNFHHFNKHNPGTPIAVDMEFRVPIAGIMLKGNFELIREILDESNGSRYVELVDFKTTNTNLDPFLIKNDLNLTIASYAFRNLFQSEEDRLKYHYLETGRDIITKRTENDFKRLEAVVTGVAEAIQKQHFYPRQTFMCRSCEVKDICDRVQY